MTNSDNITNIVEIMEFKLNPLENKIILETMKIINTTKRIKIRTRKSLL